MNILIDVLQIRLGDYYTLRHLLPISLGFFPIIALSFWSSISPPAPFNRLFHFHTMRLHHPGFPDVVREAWELESILPNAIKLFTDRVTHWNKTMFGNLFAKKRIILARINGTQKTLSNGPNQFLIQLEQDLMKEYSKIRL